MKERCKGACKDGEVADAWGTRPAEPGMVIVTGMRAHAPPAGCNQGAPSAPVGRGGAAMEKGGTGQAGVVPARQPAHMGGGGPARPGT